MFSEVFINIGVASALVVVVQSFLKHLRDTRRSCDQCRSEHTRVLTNHVEHNTQALERLADAASKQTEALKELSERLR